MVMITRVGAEETIQRDSVQAITVVVVAAISVTVKFNKKRGVKSSFCSSGGLKSLILIKNNKYKITYENYRV